VGGQLCGFQGPGEGLVSTPFGGDSEGDTPLPIPNREVKPLSADGTWASRPWESRSPPVLTEKGRPVWGGPSVLGDPSVWGGLYFVARGRPLGAPSDVPPTAANACPGSRWSSLRSSLPLRTVQT
jgi:hypothetical protein